MRKIRGRGLAERAVNEPSGIDGIDSGAEDALKIVAKLWKGAVQ
jgi:hypothetical protein